MVRIASVLEYMESRYPKGSVEDWDRVGFIVGGRTHEVRKILLAVDPVPEVVAEAIDTGCQLLITHHPLYLRGTSYVSSDDAKGRMVRDLIRADCALFCAHTNADVAVGGVADALGSLVGLEDMAPLVDRGVGSVGIGRVGKVKRQTLRDFSTKVSSVLPKGPTGLYVGGNLDSEVETVAVSGGAGDSLLGAARQAGADVFLTADLRHHPASEHLMEGPPALLCGSHWATEWPWLPHLATELTQHCGDGTLEVSISTVCTEPWVEHLPTRGRL